jgi:choline dehydrogenase-like flavoprotein
MDWRPQEKFMQPVRARAFDCGAHCMLGCRCGAKWSAAEFVDDAVAEGCDVWTGAHVQRVLVEDGVATGVVGMVGGRRFTIHAGVVILAAGGIGTPRLLQRSGLPGAGQGMVMDTTVMVYGHAPFKGNGLEPPMTWSYADDELGVLYSTLIDPWLLYPLIMASKGPAYSLTWHRWGHTLGVMIKLKDEISGGILADGRIHKGLTAGDRQRLTQAEGVAKAILLRAGCDSETIFTTPIRGTHPSGTVRIGELVNTDLETEVRGLYVCDASVFPEALARPTVLTIIGLARRLADYLL